MKTIELSAALNNAAVKETLKNFVGVDETGNMGLMTPERLAAVAGESSSFGYAKDLNGEVGYNTVGMFNKDTLNIPTFANGERFGIYEVSKAKFNTGNFIVQKLYIPFQNEVYIRFCWNSKWQAWSSIVVKRIE